MTVFWPDIHPSFQAGFDPALVRKAGCVALVCKVTEGSGWYRQGYSAISTKAKAHDIGFAAYHFVRAESSGESQARWTKEMMGTDWGRVPVMLDWETSITGSKAPPTTAAAYVREARRIGGRVTMNYCPHWFWASIGGPNLAAFPFNTLALVQSSYGVNERGPIRDIYPGDSSPRWNGYGNRAVDVLQFGSRCRIPGWNADLDINAYRGTETQLRRSGLFHWPTEEKTMPDWDERNLVPADLVTHFPPEINVEPDTQFSLSRLLWLGVLYPSQVRATVNAIKREMDALRDQVAEIQETLTAVGAEVTELLTLVRDTGGGNPDTATLLEAIRAEGANIRDNAVGAVVDALRQGTGPA